MPKGTERFVATPFIRSRFDLGVSRWTHCVLKYTTECTRDSYRSEGNLFFPSGAAFHRLCLLLLPAVPIEVREFLRRPDSTVGSSDSMKFVTSCRSMQGFDIPRNVREMQESNAIDARDAAV